MRSYSKNNHGNELELCPEKTDISTASKEAANSGSPLEVKHKPFPVRTQVKCPAYAAVENSDMMTQPARTGAFSGNWYSQLTSGTTKLSLRCMPGTLRLRLGGHRETHTTSVTVVYTRTYTIKYTQLKKTTQLP